MDVSTNPSAPRLPRLTLLPGLALLALVLVMLPGLVTAQQTAVAPEQVASAQGPASVQPAGQTPQAVVPATTPSPTPTLISIPCDAASSSPPDSAKIIRGVREEEIGAVFSGSNNNTLYRLGYNYSSSSSALQYIANDGMTSIVSSWTAGATVDFAGDRYDDLVEVYKDSTGMLAAYSFSGVSGAPPTVWWTAKKLWTAGAGTTQGGELSYIDVTAGNLMRRADRKEMVVIAFSNANHDLQQIALTGGSDGLIYQASGAAFRTRTDTGSNRGTVHHVRVTHGDLDGNGWDDEIVAAFQDSGNDLQILVTKLGDTTAVENGWQGVATVSYSDSSKSYWAHDICPSGDDSRSARRCLDVTTGDVDGDNIDEVIVAFADNGDNLQVRVLKRSGWTLVPVAEGSGGANFFYRADPDTRDMDYISVAAPDLEGDGQDEIVVAFGGRVDYRPTLSDQGEAPVQVWTLRVAPDANGDPKVGLDPYGIYKDAVDYPSTYTAPQEVSVAEINVDLATGEQEVALAFDGSNEGGDNDPVVLKVLRQTTVYKAASGSLPAGNYKVLEEKAHAVIGYSDDGGPLSVIVGDFDANSVRLKYDNVCKRYGFTNLNTVANLPPLVGDSHTGAVEVAYGKTFAQSGTTGKNFEASVGASVEIDGSQTVLGLEECGPIFTTEFEYTHGVTKEESSGTEITTELSVDYDPGNPSSPSAFGFALSDDVQYQAYKYVDESGQLGVPVWVRVPKDRGTRNKSLEYWNADNFLAGWQQLGYRNNLTRGRVVTATQSSTLYTTGGGATLAVDGNTDGNYYNGSVTHTAYEMNPWWQVDLGSVQSIGSIDIWNRSDAVPGRLANYVVKVSETGDDWDSPKWQSGTMTAAAGYPTPIRVSRTGRYVRVQLLATNYLSIAEVQVWGTREASTFPKAISRIDDNSFKIQSRSGAWTTISDANLKWDWCQGYLDTDPALPATAMDPVEVAKGGVIGSWTMTEAFGQTTTTEDTWAVNQSLLFEAKAAGVGVTAGATWGFAGGKSHSVSWDNTTYFEGSANDLKDESAVYNYTYCPYYYTVKKTTADGTDQGYLVLDYYVPCISSDPASPCATTTRKASAAARPTGTLAVKPLPPEIASSTHPDPDAWSTENTATFTWQQPAGDPAQVVAYRWYLDHQPDTVPDEYMQSLNQEYTYRNVEDGTWYLHVRAQGVDEWSDTAHRQIRIDRLAPAVTLTLDPPAPQGNQGWYTTTLTVAAAATDTGSGLAAIQISTDGATWQAYAGSLNYTADTPPTTIWARASDVAGHVSDPVMTAFKIDLAAPDSHAVGEGCIWGVCRAEVVTDAQGNEHLVLGGQIHEATSGRAGMHIQANGGSWTSANALGDWYPPDRPTVAINWVYTATLEIGHGYHIFNGRAADNAGHLEEPYKIAEFIWYPLNSPDLSQSSIVIEPAVAKPGDTVMVTVNVRNGGRQESHVSIKATLPAGLKPAEGALASVDGTTVYDGATGVITWPEILLWQGQDWRFTFPAVVAAGMPAGTLTAKLDLHGFWPNSDLLPPVMRQQFLDKEVTAAITASLAVDPALPANRDVTAPHVQLAIAGGEVPDSDTVGLKLSADADARWMYVREWTLDPVSGAWIVAHNSGWLDYAPSLDWDLSAGAGVKYIGTWVADAAGNVSRLDEASLAFTNRLIDDKLLAGQRRQYRFTLGQGLAAFNLLAHSGQADLYAWMPKLGQYPSYVGVGSTSLKAVGFQIQVEGVHLVEAAAAQEASYTLLPAAGPAPAAASSLDQQAAALPNHPLSMSTPLTGGAGAAPMLELKPVYLPIIVR